MSRKLSFLLLGAFLLAQCCQARPSHFFELFQSDISKRTKLFDFVLDELKPLANQSVTRAKALFKNTLHELTAEKEKSATTEGHITELSHFVEEVEKYEAYNDDPIELFKLFGKLGMILIVTEEEPPKSENSVYMNALKKHGLDKFNSENVKDLREFAEKVEKEVDHYLGGLSEKEKENESKMFDWLSEYKAEKDEEKKFELLPKFIKLRNDVETSRNLFMHI